MLLHILTVYPVRKPSALYNLRCLLNAIRLGCLSIRHFSILFLRGRCLSLLLRLGFPL